MNREFVSNFHSVLRGGPEIDFELADQGGSDYINFNIIVMDKNNRKKRSRPNKTCFLRKKNPNKSNIIVKSHLTNLYFLRRDAFRLRNVIRADCEDNRSHEYPIKDHMNFFYSILVGPKAITYEQLLNLELPQSPEEEEKYMINVYSKYIKEFLEVVPAKRTTYVTVFNRMFKMWSKYHGFYPVLTSKYYKQALHNCGVRKGEHLRGGKKIYVLP